MNNPQTPSKGGKDTVPTGPKRKFFCTRKAGWMLLDECVQSFLDAESYGPKDNLCRRCERGSQNYVEFSRVKPEKEPAAAPRSPSASMPASIGEHRRFLLVAIAEKFSMMWFSPIDLRRIKTFEKMGPGERLTLLAEITREGYVMHLGSRYMLKEWVVSELERQGEI
ncbi:MAG: hypothetical protein HY982_00785 [Candidatus Magasanikbacteria bacterium]|nr:hypothetical protein [Candidatus Magasanikbacteria bacterium]